MMTGADVVAEALSWAGTPIQRQASVKGLGCDCKGLIVGVARVLGLAEADSAFARINDYGVVDVALLKRGLRETFERLPVPADRMAIRPGAVMLLVMKGRAQHLAIATGGGKMIHPVTGPNIIMEVSIGASRVIDSLWWWGSIDG